MSKRLVVFNHKGGVSKTTTVYNLGWMLSKKYRVLVVDADPQCNLSSLILGDDFEKYYVDETTKLHNIKDGVDSAFRGRPVPIKAVDCCNPPRAETLFLLAGHQNLSEFDPALTFAHMSNNAIATLENLPGAFSELIKQTEDQYEIDYTLIDINPSLSAINQNLFLLSHAFLIPTNPDPFSIMAIHTLQTILPRWSEWKNASFPLFENSVYPLLDGLPKFVGSIFQRFNIRRGKAAKPYRNNIDEIKEKMRTDFIQSMEVAGMTLNTHQYGKDFVESSYFLSEIPDFQGLLPRSYQAGVPIFELRDEELGESGTVFSQLCQKRTVFYDQFERLSTKLVDLLHNT